MRIRPITPALAELGRSIQTGDVDALSAALEEDPSLAAAYFGDDDQARTALHMVTDFPGHVAGNVTMIGLLVAAGADVDARFIGAHRETPLHWAASCDDIDAIEALLDAGADIEAGGGVLTGGPPLDDAVIFGQLLAARTLVARGAKVGLYHAAALGMADVVTQLLADEPPQPEIDNALWHACNTGEATTGSLLLDAGADPGWAGYNDETPVDAARRSGNAALIERLARS